MADGTSVTLVFYRVGSQWWKEPALNLIAAAAQRSAYTHVEIAIGEDPGHGGQMANVARVFNGAPAAAAARAGTAPAAPRSTPSPPTPATTLRRRRSWRADAVGVELTERTGRNPAYTYLSLGCSKVAEQKMLAFARAQTGKPFSNAGMARSLVWPRQTDGSSWFCAELVAAILKVGGLMHQESNPGAATPYSLYKLYSQQAAATANPYTLRAVQGLTFATVIRNGGSAAHVPLLADDRAAAAAAASARAPAPTGVALPRAVPTPVHSGRRRPDSPPRASFRLLTANGPVPGHARMSLSMRSLLA